MMRVLLLAVLLGSAWSAQGHHGGHGAVVLEFSEVGSMTAEVDIRLEGPDAARMRQQMDRDGDGHVSADEASSASEQQFNMTRTIRLGLPIGLVLLDGTHPDVEVVSVEYLDASGAVESDARITQRWHVEHTFNVSEGSEHRFQLDTANRSVQGHLRVHVDDVRVLAPPGYVINGTGGLPWGAAVAQDSRSLTMSGIDKDHGWIDIGFSREATMSDAVEAPLPWTWLVGLAALVLVRRRAARFRVRLGDPKKF